MQFKSIKTKYKLALSFGIIAVLMGLLLIIEYVVTAVIERMGEADQSLLFWYLPFFLLGVMALKLGAAFSIWGFINLKKKKNNLS